MFSFACITFSVCFWAWIDFVFTRNSLPSSPTPPKPQRVKKSRSRDSYVSQNSTDSSSGKWTHQPLSCTLALKVYRSRDSYVSQNSTDSSSGKWTHQPLSCTLALKVYRSRDSYVSQNSTDSSSGKWTCPPLYNQDIRCNRVIHWLQNIRQQTIFSQEIYATGIYQYTKKSRGQRVEQVSIKCD